MVWVQHVLTNLLHVGIGRAVVAHDNPVAYPFFLVALGFSVLLAIFNTIRYRRVSAAIGQVIGLLFALGLLYLTWLIYAWPIDRLPLWHAPVVSSVWLFGLPGRTSYVVIAIAVHCLMIYFGTGLFLGITWAYQSGYMSFYNTRGERDSNLVHGVPIVLGLPTNIALIGLVETRGVSPVVVAPLELLLIVFAVGWALEYFVNYAVSRIFPEPSASSAATFQDTILNRCCTRFVSALTYLLFFVGLFVIAYSHPTSFQILQLCGVYLALIWIDSIIAGVLAAFNTAAGNIDMLSPHRWIITIPLTLLISVLGATGVFQSRIGLATIAPAVWTQAGAAAAAYMLFKPLVALARYTAGAREYSEETDGLQRFLVDVLSLNILNPNERAFGKYVSSAVSSAAFRIGVQDGGSSAADTDTASTQQPSPEQLMLQQMLDTVTRTLNIEEMRRKTVAAEETRGQMVVRFLDFSSGVTFLGMLIIFHYLLLYVNVFQSLNGLLVTIVFGAVTLITGMLNLLDNKLIRLIAPVVLLQIFVIGLVAAVSSFTVLVPSIDANPSNMMFFATMQQLLIFLTLGQVLYTFQLINGIIKVQVQEAQPLDSTGRYDYALSLYRSGHYELAAKQFDEATQVDHDNAEAFHLWGYAYRNLERYAEAENYIKRAIAVASSSAGAAYHERLWDYYDSLGEVCAVSGRFADACVAFQQSLACRSPNPTTLKKYIQALRSAGRNVETDTLEKTLPDDETKDTNTDSN